MKYLILSNNDPAIFKRQIPKSRQDDFYFYPDDQTVFDIALVYDQLPSSIDWPIKIRKKILIHGEPPTIKKYKRKFNSQFDLVITSDRSVSKKYRKLSQQFLPWHIGYFRNKIIGKEIYNYEFYKQNTFAKSKEICVISSNKNYPLRLDFVNKLSNHFGAAVDIYGRGFNDFVDKIDFLTNYKYCIVLENSSLPNYWTEKLSDSYLANCYPIYWGCRNINQYFPTDSLTAIDIRKPSEAIKIIENVIDSEKYELNYSKILLAKEYILTNYNIANIAELFDVFSDAFKTVVLKREDSFPRLRAKIKKILGG